jgi:hypothetical protein
MNSSDLTSSQADEIYKRLRPASAYLAALERRMAERQFDGDDRLYLEVRAARCAMQLLCKDLHRIVCGPSYRG